jgi:hypothetical protein
VNHKDSSLVGKHLNVGEVFYVGSTVSFPSDEKVAVESCLLSPPGFSSFLEAPPVRWRVCFFPMDSSKNLKESKPPLGRLAFLILKPHENRIVLLDSKEQVLDARFLLINERIRSGQFFDLKVYTVLVGERIVSDSIDQGIKMMNLSSVVEEPQFPSKLNEAVQDNFALDFDKGKKFASTCMDKFGYHICHQPQTRRGPFLLVISFGRAVFRLDIHTVAMCLQASFGGTASLFKVQHLRDRSFKFSVSSSAVGFEIYNLGKFSDKNFEFFINLWGQGGPNWKFE